VLISVSSNGSPDKRNKLLYLLMFLSTWIASSLLRWSKCKSFRREWLRVLWMLSMIMNVIAMTLTTRIWMSFLQGLEFFQRLVAILSSFSNSTSTTIFSLVSRLFTILMFIIQFMLFRLHSSVIHFPRQAIAEVQAELILSWFLNFLF